ncbi:MAG: MBL fold metallo-hydrolase [Clostridia bacterium]|nr:MBL fold metallo-hydrolase [Clostridia bacterium]
MQKRYRFILGIIIAIVLAVSTVSDYLKPDEKVQISDAALSVHFIDVGQADAALLFSGGKTMLIDGGNREDSSLIAAYLKKYGISHLDYVICSHAHEDHVGGLPGALSVATAGEIFAPRTEADTKVYQNFKAKAKEQGIPIQNPSPGDSFAFGKSTAVFLGPITEKTDELNNTSLVLKVTYGETSFLFTGDAERDEELSITDAGQDVSATVLKVGHHGSNSSTSYPFLREVMPKIAVISVGKNNDYGHPDDKVLTRLRDAGVKVFRTDEMGDIIIETDGKNISTP